MGRHLAIGDIHGCYESLRHLTEAIRLRDSDVLITLGDYVDRGPESSRVLDWLIETEKFLQLRSLRGNHEEMMLEARREPMAFKQWLKCGGKATLKSYGLSTDDPDVFEKIPESHWKWIETRTVAFVELESVFCVHANVDPALPLVQQDRRILYWKKLGKNAVPIHSSGKKMVCGHTSQKNGFPIVQGNAICLDSRVYDTGWLTCLHIESGGLWQAHRSGQIRHLHLSQLQGIDSVPQRSSRTC